VRIPPEYPPTQLEGFVVVRLWVGAQGEVARAEVAQANPPRVFDRVALDAVRRWRYRPAQRDGAAIAYGPLAVMLDFKLAR
jgi:protein TonB